MFYRDHPMGMVRDELIHMLKQRWRAFYLLPQKEQEVINNKRLVQVQVVDQCLTYYLKHGRFEDEPRHYVDKKEFYERIQEDSGFRDSKEN